MSKFEWIWRLGRDGRLSYADRYILTMTALKSTHARTLTFTVRQSTIAENFAASERTVRRALAAGRRLGYLELITTRKRGRGNHGANEYRLTVPTTEIPASVAVIHDGKYRPPAPKIAATGAENSGQTRLADQHELQRPLGLYKVSRRSAADAAPPPALLPEPNQHCPRHMPNGTTTACRPCGEKRKEHEAWQVECDRKVREARAQARRDCNICGGHLHVLGPDLTPIEPHQWCPVCKPKAKDNTA